MEQTKNEPKNENKAAPDNGKPKKERKPLTEAQRLKRQKMIVLPAIVLVFIGAMWLIFAPSSDKEQQPGTGGYNIEMPDADKANRQIIGDKAKAYEQGAMEERQENRSRAMQELGDMFDREVAETDGGRDFDLANPGNAEDATAKSSAPKTIQSSAAAYRDLNTTLGNFYEQPKNDNAEMDELLERIASLNRNWKPRKARHPLWMIKWHSWKSPTSWRRSTWAVRTVHSHLSDRRQNLTMCRKPERTRLHLSGR